MEQTLLKMSSNQTTFGCAALAVPPNPYPNGFQQTPVFGVDDSHYTGQDFTLLNFQQTGALVYKIIISYGMQLLI